MSKINSTQKVFCIGCHKTGTLSLADFATQHGYDAFHDWGWSNPVPNKEVLANFNFFADGGGHVWDRALEKSGDIFGGNHNILYLHQHFPDALYILNTRKILSWMVSKMYHAGWRANTDVENSDVELCNKNWRTKSYDMLEEWVKNRELYHSRVLEFFDQPHTRSRFLVLDYIDNPNSIKLLQDFLGLPTKQITKLHSNKSRMNEEDRKALAEIAKSVISNSQEQNND